MNPETRQQVMRLLERVRLWELHPVHALTEIFELLEKEVSPMPPDTGVTLLGPPPSSQPG